MENRGEHKTVRELIAELADLEERIGRIQTFVHPEAPGVSPINPELIKLAKRESQVIAALRRHRSGR